MKTVGIVRRIDELGRITIPMEIRNTFDIEVRDPMEIYTSEDGIIMLKKYVPETACAFCSKREDVHKINGKHFCGDCIRELRTNFSHDIP